MHTYSDDYYQARKGRFHKPQVRIMSTDIFKAQIVVLFKEQTNIEKP